MSDEIAELRRRIEQLEQELEATQRQVREEASKVMFLRGVVAGQRFLLKHAMKLLLWACYGQNNMADETPVISPAVLINDIRKSLEATEELTRTDP